MLGLGVWEDVRELARRGLNPSLRRACQRSGPAEGRQGTAAMMPSLPRAPPRCGKEAQIGQWSAGAKPDDHPAPTTALSHNDPAVRTEPACGTLLDLASESGPEMRCSRRSERRRTGRRRRSRSDRASAAPYAGNGTTHEVRSGFGARRPRGRAQPGPEATARIV
jgi:hypothetical protein